MCCSDHLYCPCDRAAARRLYVRTRGRLPLGRRRRLVRRLSRCDSSSVNRVGGFLRSCLSLLVVLLARALMRPLCLSSPVLSLEITIILLRLCSTLLPHDLTFMSPPLYPAPLRPLSGLLLLLAPAPVHAPEILVSISEVEVADFLPSPGPRFEGPNDPELQIWPLCLATDWPISDSWRDFAFSTVTLKQSSDTPGELSSDSEGR